MRITDSGVEGADADRACAAASSDAARRRSSSRYKSSCRDSRTRRWRRTCGPCQRGSCRAARASLCRCRGAACAALCTPPLGTGDTLPMPRFTGEPGGEPRTLLAVLLAVLQPLSVRRMFTLAPMRRAKLRKADDIRLVRLPTNYHPVVIGEGGAGSPPAALAFSLAAHAALGGCFQHLCRILFATRSTPTHTFHGRTPGPLHLKRTGAAAKSKRGSTPPCALRLRWRLGSSGRLRRRRTGVEIHECLGVPCTPLSPPPLLPPPPGIGPLSSSSSSGPLAQRRPCRRPRPSRCRRRRRGPRPPPPPRPAHPRRPLPARHLCPGRAPA